jgi:hypothetical protein
MVSKVALAWMLGFSLATAEEKTSPPTAVTEKPDFSAGFQRLVTLGLPSLEGAEWSSNQDDSMGDYYLRELLSGLKGKGWKIQTNGKPAFLPLGAVKSAEIAADAPRGGGGLLGALLGGGSKKAKSVDLVADANKLISILEDPEKSKELRESLEYSGTSSLGRLLVFATQLHQSGHPTEANHLANTVFSLGASPESVIDSAINQLASRDLGLVTEDLFIRKDWAAYERDLRALTVRYPRGWQAFPAVQMLLPAVAKRVAGVMPAKPTIKGVALNPEAIAALDEALQDTKGAPDDEAVTRYAKENGIPLANLTPDLRSRIAEMLAGSDEGRSGGPWLIEEPPGEEAKDPWSRLKKLRLDALPALAAVAGDETLTFSRNSSSGRSSYYSSSRESAADQALSAYQSMDRPLTRGELACRLLASALPGENQGESGSQALADSAMEFWKAHQKKSRLELLLVFLADGDSYQKQTASTALAEMPDEAAHQAFEKYVLETDDIISTLSSVTPYLKLRKAAARDFFTRYSAVLKSQLEGTDLEQISGGYQIKQAGGVDKYLKKLSLFVSGESPRKLVLELAKAEKPNLQQIQSLAATVQESSPDQLVPLFLEAAVMATHLETRLAFLSAFPGRRYRGNSENEEEAGETPIPSAQIANWTTLLGDERPAASGEAIRQLAAGTLEQLHSPGTLERIYLINQLDPRACSELILARAKDRVAGKSPTPLPDPEKVTAARVDEILKQLAAAKTEAVHELAKSWPLEEQLAFLKWRSDPENVAKLPANLIASRKLLTPPIETAGSPTLAQMTEIRQSLDLKPKAKIEYELITHLANTLALAARKQSGLVAIFANSPLDTGVALYAFQLFEPAGKTGMYGSYYMSQAQPALREPGADAVVAVSWASDRRGESAIWKINDKTITPPEAGVLEKLREVLAVLDQPETTRLQIMISVLHRDDLEKLNKLNQSNSDEDSENPEE